MSAQTPTGVVLARITGEPVEPREVERAVWTPSDGAVVTFTGVVRDHDGGHPVRMLEYSAHPRAERILAKVCAAVAAGHGGEGRPVHAAAIHRVGPLAIGDVAVTVAVSSAHRAEAFRTCAELIERIKHEVPIWKRQLYTNGMSEWVGAGECSG